MPVSEALRRKYHRTARFWPSRRDEPDGSATWPAVEYAGAFVFTYVEGNTLVVSIDLDTVHRGLVERPGTQAAVPLHVMVQGTTVFYAPSERSGHTAWRVVGPGEEITLFAAEEERQAKRLARESGGRLQFRPPWSAEWLSAAPGVGRLPWTRRWRIDLRAAAARFRARVARRGGDGRWSR